MRYRNTADVARYQDWAMPYTRDLAHALLDELAGTNGPTPNAWVQLAVTGADDRMVGDLAVWLDESASLAMIGYTLAPRQQGKGYATEAVAALLDWLVARNVHRVAATLDPLNLASARVLERCGFRYTGTARSAALVRGTWEDDARFEILADEWKAWRSAKRVKRVDLVEITRHNVRDVLDLDRAFSQRQFVSSVAQSYGDALVTHEHHGEPLVPWYRAIRADGRLAGFMMVAEPRESVPHPYLWRVLVDWRYQRRGVGARAIGRLAEDRAVRGSTHLLLSCVADVPGTPEPFYRRLGFRRTGRVNDWGETEMIAPLARLLG
jgi:RimJ/RimL family protein N-acetyltransferase/ribosomal protein S18 acetylase RimI-like enzyme